MKFIFGAVGAVLGALMGGAFAALVGAALGVALAVMLADAEKKAERTSTAPRANAIETRVARLEQEVAALRAEVHRLTPASVVATPIVVAATPPSPEPEPMPEPEPQFVDTTPVAIDLPPEPPARPPRAPAPPSLSVEERLPSFLRQWIFGGNTIVKVGVLILFLGLAFLLRYAAERVTVPVELRYAGVALLGAVLLALGWRLRERKDAAGGSGYGLILQGAGVGVFYLTTLAALKLNQLLPPELAFGFLFMVAVLSAVLAVAQNAPWLAYVAAAEGFAAPVLVSTGSGNQIALFSYLAVLDVGIVLMAWFRAWRPLNLIGFVGTFALAGTWAQRYYTDAHYPVTQAFLLLFFGLYTAVGVLFARRALALGPPPDAQHPLAQRAAQALANVGRVDSALVFGVPLASYGMQYLLVRHDEFGPAWAALGFALFYLLLGGVLLRRSPSRYSLLGEAYVIVSVIFGTLAIPLALEGAWTGATWAVEAAGMYWLGTRQQRRYARAFALLVLAGATLRLATSLQLDATPGAPLLVGSLLGMLLLCVSALAMFIVGQRARIEELAAWEAVGHVAQLWIGLAAAAAMAWLVFAPVWACVATSLLGVVALRIGLRWSQSPAFAVAWCALQLGAGLSFLAFGPELWAAQSASLTLWTPLVLALAALISGDAMQRDKNAALRAPWVQWAVVLWSLAWWTQVLPPDAYRALRRTQSDWALLWPAVLTGWVLLSSMLVTLLARWRDWRVLGQSTWVSVPAWVLTAWLGVGLGGYAPHAHLGWLVWPLALAWHMVLLRTQTRWWSANALAPLHVGGFWLFVLLAAREAQWWTASWGEPGSAWPLLGWALVPALVLSLMTRPRMLQRWPLAAFRDAYLLVACAPLAVYLLAWLWASNTQSGAAAPLPYVPLLNPLELGHGLVLLSLFLWRGALPAQAIAPRPLLLAGLGATAFALYTGVVLRTCHHWAGVPWDSHALFASTLTQAALSVAWAIVGVALMLFGHRRVQRGVWIVGAALLGVVVAKLFFVELADRGGLYRIVSFIVVGLLLLTVGYFAPVPPNRDDLRSKA
ncbi:MAG TPA: DUF2339 domain-containing protein [Albitalea sp.]|nr:DUF2339 domain-containing protein [Albitalea sp.]